MRVDRKLEAIFEILRAKSRLDHSIWIPIILGIQTKWSKYNKKTHTNLTMSRQRHVCERKDAISHNKMMHFHAQNDAFWRERKFSHEENTQKFASTRIGASLVPDENVRFSAVINKKKKRSHLKRSDFGSIFDVRTNN